MFSLLFCTDIHIAIVLDYCSRFVLLLPYFDVTQPDSEDKNK